MPTDCRPDETREPCLWRARSLLFTAAAAWLTSLAVLVAAQPAAAPPTLPEAARAAAALPQLRSLLVSRRGDLLLKYYATGTRATGLANIKSASKSVISALVGIALDRRLMPRLDEPIVTYFPELNRDPDPRKTTITVEDLLTMRSGLESTSGSNYGSWVSSRNWVRGVLAKPIVSEPGTTMEYSTGTSHLLSAIITKVSKTSTWQFAQDRLAAPLGISLARWPRDPQGIYFGGNEMLMTPRQMVRFGELFLNRGRVGNRQVVPEAWVAASCVPRTRSRFDPDREYGYGWWVQPVGGRASCFAWGFGGQYIWVVPELQLVVVATSSTTVSDERRGHRRLLFDLLERDVLPQVAAIGAGPGSGFGPK